MTKGLREEIKQLIDQLEKAHQAFQLAQKQGLPPEPHPIYIVLYQLEKMNLTLLELWKEDQEALKYLERLCIISK